MLAVPGVSRLTSRQKVPNDKSAIVASDREKRPLTIELARQRH